MDPAGEFVYVATSLSNNVSAYRIGFNGALTPVPGSPFATGLAPVSIAIAPAARYAYVASKISNNVSAYSISSNGALTPVPGSPFPAGIGPISVAVDPTGKFAYVVNGSGERLSVRDRYQWRPDGHCRFAFRSGK